MAPRPVSPSTMHPLPPFSSLRTSSSLLHTCSIHSGDNGFILQKKRQSHCCLKDFALAATLANIPLAQISLQISTKAHVPYDRSLPLIALYYMAPTPGLFPISLFNYPPCYLPPSTWHTHLRVCLAPLEHHGNSVSGCWPSE